MSVCRSCEAPIEWATTEAGKSMPLDRDPVLDGEWTFIGGKTRKATDEDRQLRRPLYKAHWATCPDAASFKRRK